MWVWSREKLVLNNFIDYKVTYQVIHNKYFHCHVKLIHSSLLCFTKSVKYI